MDLTEDERLHYDRWLRHLAGGDDRMLALLEASVGRIAANTLRSILRERGGDATMKLGDLPASKPLPFESELIVSWLRDAIDHDADWLRDVDSDGIPVRLAACESLEALLEAAQEDFTARRWALP